MKGRSIARLAVGLALAAGLVALLVFAFRPRPVPADFAVVTRGPLVVAVEAEGRTRVREVYEVSMPVDGRLRRIDVDVGDVVWEGDTELARIEPIFPTIHDARTRRELQAAVEAAEAALRLARAEVDRVEAELEFARSDWRRQEQLYERGTISEAVIDRARLEVRRQEAMLAEASATVNVRSFELHAARARLIEPQTPPENGAPGDACCLTVSAPVSGRILRVFKESAAVVRSGEPILEIGDDRDLEIVTDLLSTDAVRVEEGAAVTIEDWGGDVPLEGRVRRVEPFGFTKVSALGIEEQRVNVIIDLVSERPLWARLGHGYRLDTVIELWRGEDVVRAPLGALFREDGAWRVFRVVDDRAVPTAVEVGHRGAFAVAIVAGLAAGDGVSEHPSDRLGAAPRVARRD